MGNINKKEIDLIAEFETEYGQPDNWDEETINLFNKCHDEIIKKEK